MNTLSQERRGKRGVSDCLQVSMVLGIFVLDTRFAGLDVDRDDVQGRLC